MVPWAPFLRVCASGRVFQVAALLANTGLVLGVLLASSSGFFAGIHRMGLAPIGRGSFEIVSLRAILPFTVLLMVGSILLVFVEAVHGWSIPATAGSPGVFPLPDLIPTGPSVQQRVDCIAGDLDHVFRRLLDLVQGCIKLTKRVGGEFD